MPEVKEVDVECCGQHEVCERDSLLAAVSKKIEYYDDEELDLSLRHISGQYFWNNGSSSDRYPKAVK